MAAIMNVSNEDLRPSTMPVRAPAAMATEQDERLVRLLANGTEGQWSSNEDIDWDREPLVPGRISSSLYTEAVSQLYYGEIATVRVCRRLLDELNGPRVRLFLQTQIGDETRHAGIYGGYLERLGGLAPMDDVLAAALDRAMAWPGSYHGLIVAFHILLEGEALRLQQDLVKWFPCPLLAQINRKISRDEARHVAFGKILLQNEITNLDAEERMEIYLQVKEMWSECSRAAIRRFAKPSAVAKTIAHYRLGRRWARAVRTFEEIGLVTGHASHRAVQR